MSHDNKLLTPTNTAAGLLGMTGLAAGSKVASKALADPHFQQKTLDSFQNFLDSFYKKGKLPPPLFRAKQGVLAFSEGVKGSASMIGESLNYARQQAYNKTGLTNRTYKTFKGYLNAIDNERARFFTQYGTLGAPDPEYIKGYKIANRNVNSIIKKMHAKLTSDYANERLIPGSRSPMERAHYASRGIWYKTQKGRSVAPYVDVSATNKMAIADLGKKEFDYVKDVWGLKDAKRLRWVKYANTPVQDAMRGVKFHRPFYHAVLGSLATEGKVGKPSFDSFINAGYKTGLINKSEKNKNFRMLNNKKGHRRIAISFSPAQKPVYDWGGYNAIAVYDEATNKIKIITSDKRDLFGLKVGKNTMNYMQPDVLDPNSYLKQAKEFHAKESSNVKSGITQATKEFNPDMKARGNKGTRGTTHVALKYKYKAGERGATRTYLKTGELNPLFDPNFDWDEVPDEYIDELGNRKERITAKRARKVQIGTHKQELEQIKKIVGEHEKIVTNTSLSKAKSAYKTRFKVTRKLIGKGLLGGLGGALSLAFLAKEIYDEFNE